MPAESTAAGDPALTPEEREEARARFEAELAADHAERLEKVQRREARARSSRTGRDQEARNAALNALKADVQNEFYKANGYRLYTDSTGRKHWLAPEEYDQRMERRRRRRHRMVEPAVMDRTRNIVFVVGMVLLAIVLGFALAR